MDFQITTPTTHFRDRLAVMVEADFNDERGLAVEQTTLTRLHDACHKGEGLADEQWKMVRDLMSQLNIGDTKTVTLVALAIRGAEYRTFRTRQVILSRPLGPYYTKISLDYISYHLDALEKLWDENPIEQCELSMIPGGLEFRDLDSHRIARCEEVSLQFENVGFNEVLALLTEVQWGCRVLEIRNPSLTQQQKEAMKLRLKHRFTSLTTVRS
jgi:hypothetical protein